MSSVNVGELRLAFRSAGNRDKPALVLLHGWPHSSALYGDVIDMLGVNRYVLAFDLPDVGASRGTPPSSEKHILADIMLSAAEAAGAHSIVMAGLDVGGMIAFAAARDHAERVNGAVIMNTVIPGVEPWSRVIADPRIWHFAFHEIPALPELLVTGHQRRYFDFFFDVLAKKKAALTNDLRDELARAYMNPDSLHAGFEWYRAFPNDAERNSQFKRISVPLLYVRGDADGRSIDDYVNGLQNVGAANVQKKVIAGSGEYLPVETPIEFVRVLMDFARWP